MNPRDRAILHAATMMLDVEAMLEAALSADFEDARFRAERILDLSATANLRGVTAAAAHLVAVLGPPGLTLAPGSGLAMLQLTEELGSATSPLFRGQRS